jgi:hypothetical protein
MHPFPLFPATDNKISSPNTLIGEQSILLLFGGVWQDPSDGSLPISQMYSDTWIYGRQKKEKINPPLSLYISLCVISTQFYLLELYPLHVNRRKEGRLFIVIIFANCVY